MTYQYKMLGVLTLFRPDVQVAADNIRRYAGHLDALVVWDNSPMELKVRDHLMSLIQDIDSKVIWSGDGENHMIAKPVNDAWKYARKHCYDFLLIMDQDSRWDNFATYRRKIEEYWKEGKKWAFTPYVVGCDLWPVVNTLEFRQLFINSGTVIPVEILTAIGGADEMFPLDALDHDMAIRIQQAGFQIACLTDCRLVHTIGEPYKSERLHLMTDNYNAFRTYSIARSHLLLYRKHRRILPVSEKRRIVKEYILLRFIRIVMLEPDKWNRLKGLFKGLWEGCTCKGKNSQEQK